jgi:hypothetical protein
MAKLLVDQETGEIIPTAVMVSTSKAPAIALDISEVKVHHKEPEKLVEMIRAQAGYAVFDVSTEKGRSECRSHAANIIRCIAPALNASKALAEEAKQVVKQDLTFRKVFEDGVREIAAFHRKPLTEYEEEQERIKEAARIAEEERFAAEQYLKDWQEAIDYDELFTLRMEKEEAQRQAMAAQQADNERMRIEREVEARLEVERQRIQAEAEAKAQREVEEKLRAEKQVEYNPNGPTANLFKPYQEEPRVIAQAQTTEQVHPIVAMIKGIERKISQGEISVYDGLVQAYKIGAKNAK